MKEGPTLTVDQGAALLWLRQVGGCAAFTWDGTVAAGRKVCPLVLRAFQGLARRGLILVTTQDKSTDLLLVMLVSDEGKAFPIEPMSERRLDALLRRFDD